MHDRSEIKQHLQQTWAAGDFSAVATEVVLVGELLCESIDLRPGQKVLDVATGSGNTALAAARRWCEVTGIDFVPALLERGRERAAAERLPIRFIEGDAEELPFPDGAFDVVLSTFGVIFAPDQERAASELLRVCRPGGKIGLASWTPESFLGEMQRVVAQYLPRPPQLKPAMLWGTEQRLRQLLGAGVSSLETSRRIFTFRFRSAEDWLEFQRSKLGPAVCAFEALDASAGEKLAQDLLDLVRRSSRSGDRTVVVPAEYLEAVAVRR
jgi:SAM-dependent methyltransferase